MIAHGVFSVNILRSLILMGLIVMRTLIAMIRLRFSGNDNRGDYTDMRVTEHPILGPLEGMEPVHVTIDGAAYEAKKGEVIAAVMMANGIMTHRRTTNRHEPRGIYCGIGQCTDCVMVVNGQPNVRTCITPVEDGMEIETQEGYGKGVASK